MENKHALISHSDIVVHNKTSYDTQYTKHYELGNILRRAQDDRREQPNQKVTLRLVVCNETKCDSHNPGQQASGVTLRLV